MQTKKQSFVESLTNTAVGFIISLASTFIIFPLVGYESTPFKNLVVTVFFTVISIIRGYVIRRYFNTKVHYKPLSPAFIKSLGFKLDDTVYEHDFYYDEYILKTDTQIIIFFNYHDNGNESYDVEFFGYDLKNVGEFELQLLLKML